MSFDSTFRVNEHYTYTVAVVGAGGVGKSCVTIQYTQGSFVEDSYFKSAPIDYRIIRLEILDTAGQDEYESLRDSYMRSAQGFLLVYDITNRKSLIQMAEYYEKIIRVKETNSVPIVVCGNKIDLLDQNETARAVKKEEVLALCERWSENSRFRVSCFEVSALNRTNVDESFDKLIRIVMLANADDPLLSEEPGFEGILMPGHHARQAGSPAKQSLRHRKGTLFFHKNPRSSADRQRLKKTDCVIL